MMTMIKGTKSSIARLSSLYMYNIPSWPGGVHPGYFEMRRLEGDADKGPLDPEEERLRESYQRKQTKLVV